MRSPEMQMKRNKIFMGLKTVIREYKYSKEKAK